MLGWFQAAVCPLQIKYCTVTKLDDFFINNNN